MDIVGEAKIDTKSRERVKRSKEEWKARDKSLFESQELIKKANKLDQPLTVVPTSLAEFSRAGANLELRCFRPAAETKALSDYAIDVTERNMKQIYEDSEDGWSRTKKREELMEDDAWHLFACSKDTGLPVAFSHFRFDMEGDYEVVYCYELQVEASFRNKGIGKWMMQVLEFMAMGTAMKKVMLTCFNHNTSAVRFYEKHRYSVDSWSPDEDEELDYKIYSKVTCPKLKKQLLSKS